VFGQGPPAKKRILSVGDFQLAFRLNLLQLKDEVLFLFYLLLFTVLSPSILECPVFLLFQSPKSKQKVSVYPKSILWAAKAAFDFMPRCKKSHVAKAMLLFSRLA
jgi:hypothetical protein